MARFSRRHYQLIHSGGADTPEQVAERIAHGKAAEQANREMMERFAPLTLANFTEATAWQAERIKELMRGRANG